MVLSGSIDTTVRLWDIASGKCIREYQGHNKQVLSVDFRQADTQATSFSMDGTVRIHDNGSGKLFSQMKIPVPHVTQCNIGTDHDYVVTVGLESTILVWSVADELVKSQRTSHGMPIQRKEIVYTNAKVLLVGDSGVGKTALSNRLVHNKFIPTESTDGAWATQWQVPREVTQGASDNEIWLWDFAGQVDYRLVHQLFMEDAATAVLVFSPQNEGSFDGLIQWDRDLQAASKNPFSKILVAARIDRGGLMTSDKLLSVFLSEHGFLEPLHQTIAKTGDGCELLRTTIVESINWNALPKTTSPVLYHRIKHEIIRLRDKGIVLIRHSELKQRLQVELGADIFSLDQLDNVIKLLAGPGMIRDLHFGGIVLLRPELISRYAAAVIRKVRQDRHEL